MIYIYISLSLSLWIPLVFHPCIVNHQSQVVSVLLYYIVFVTYIGISIQGVRKYSLLVHNKDPENDQF